MENNNLIVNKHNKIKIQNHNNKIYKLLIKPDNHKVQIYLTIYKIKDHLLISSLVLDQVLYMKMILIHYQWDIRKF